MQRAPECISIEKCQDGFTYKVEARNFSIGVYNAATKSFHGIRRKFNHTFIDEEFHWDTGPPYGTAQPVKPIEQCPVNPLNRKVLFEYLQKFTNK